MPDPKPIAAVVTVYRRHSHADVIVGKILEGPTYDGTNRFPLKLVSMYVDQFPKNDMSRDLAKKHGFKLCDSIDEALTLGTGKLAVAGVLNIGEHGDYPTNKIGQTLYPRRRFFEEECKTFERLKQTVPVFSDKHLAATWADAKWMYDRSRELMVPFQAGSSVPLTWRKPDLMLPKNTELTDAVMVGYGPAEAYGFHTLEGLQCMVERRKGGETGVAAVQILSGEAMWKACDDGKFSKELVEEAVRIIPTHAKGDYREITAKNKEATVWLIEYRDGFRAAIAMLNGYVHERAEDGGAFIFAGKIKGSAKPVSCQFYLQHDDPYGHFTAILKGFEFMVRTNHPPYPLERTLLTTGVLDAIMSSRDEGGKRVETPHLKIAYTPTDWPAATGEIPKTIKR
ncbi:hypothetical protein [Zavarzinella formosa]|uniref:hypothetical protein n=1 Tax=Zavarzinella formosa TaxID=360055 RepID=UPI0002FD0B8D|nr:hypothetical protein [Zavarzinella formosa]